MVLVAKSLLKRRFVDCLERGAFYSFKASGQHILETKFQIALSQIWIRFQRSLLILMKAHSTYLLAWANTLLNLFYSIANRSLLGDKQPYFDS